MNKNNKMKWICSHVTKMHVYEYKYPLSYQYRYLQTNVSIRMFRDKNISKFSRHTDHNSPNLSRGVRHYKKINMTIQKFSREIHARAWCMSASPCSVEVIYALCPEDKRKHACACGWIFNWAIERKILFKSEHETRSYKWIWICHPRNCVHFIHVCPKVLNHVFSVSYVDFP